MHCPIKDRLMGACVKVSLGSKIIGRNVHSICQSAKRTVHFSANPEIRNKPIDTSKNARTHIAKFPSRIPKVTIPTVRYANSSAGLKFGNSFNAPNTK